MGIIFHYIPLFEVIGVDYSRLLKDGFEGWYYHWGCLWYVLRAKVSDVKGIGLALANDLAQKGWKLAIVDMNSEDGEAAVAKFGEGNAIFIKADVSKWEENVRFFKETKEAFGRIDFGEYFLYSHC